MMALFNIVPKKTDDTAQAAQELDADTGPTFTDITQEIEYQRANVVAKTKITDAVFQCAPRQFPPARAQLCTPSLSSTQLIGVPRRCVAHGAKRTKEMQLKRG